MMAMKPRSHLNAHARRVAGLSWYWSGRAIQLEHECGGQETMDSALMKFRAAVLMLLAVTFGYRE